MLWVVHRRKTVQQRKVLKTRKQHHRLAALCQGGEIRVRGAKRVDVDPFHGAGWREKLAKVKPCRKWNRRVAGKARAGGADLDAVRRLAKMERVLVPEGKHVGVEHVLAHAQRKTVRLEELNGILASVYQRPVPGRLVDLSAEGREHVRLGKVDVLEAAGHPHFLSAHELDSELLGRDWKVARVKAIKRGVDGLRHGCDIDDALGRSKAARRTPDVRQMVWQKARHGVDSICSTHNGRVVEVANDALRILLDPRRAARTVLLRRCALLLPRVPRIDGAVVGERIVRVAGRAKVVVALELHGGDERLKTQACHLKLAKKCPH
eukprot:m.160498 g.160498  ORF g.160498 m.160498 type:complete len:321 (-) comp10275_c0_seq6:796-1758(-)